MTDTSAKITFTYRPDDHSAKIRCDYPGDDPDNRDPRVKVLFEALNETAAEKLEAEGMHINAGGEARDDANAVEYVFGTEDDIPMG
jgi:hypothetical protein